MLRTKNTANIKLSEQVHQHISKKQVSEKIVSLENTISTGSTLLDLAISGGIKRGGGIPGGILVEVFGPASCGKTILLCEIAGNIQQKEGKVLFFDPEARLNKQFARLFGLNTEAMSYIMPDTIPNVFAPIRKWEPEPDNKVHGVFADSLAALSTAMELEDKDQYGMRRAKEFSEELRKTCRTLVTKNFLMVCSNQLRENVNAGPYEQKFRSPGGLSMGFYASLRLRCSSPQKIKRNRTLANGKVVSRVIGVETVIDVYKSSVWKPYHSATVPILFDYGIDDIRQNLQFIKDCREESTYVLGDQKLSKSLEHACQIVEENGFEDNLREETIDLWESIEKKFSQERKPKR